MCTEYSLIFYHLNLKSTLCSWCYHLYFRGKSSPERPPDFLPAECEAEVEMRSSKYEFHIPFTRIHTACTCGRRKSRKAKGFPWWWGCEDGVVRENTSCPVELEFQIKKEKLLSIISMTQILHGGNLLCNTTHCLPQMQL